MTNLTDEKRKELTLFLGECNYKPYWYKLGGIESCDKCGEDKSKHSNRTFTTPDDMVALAKRMGKELRWRGFILFVSDRDNYTHDWIDLYAWLLTDPARFCWLVSEFLIKTEVK